MGERVKAYFSDGRRTALTVFAVIAVIVLIVGLCLSWFVENTRLATVGKVQAPSEIKVLGPNETAMEEIPLTYEPTEFADHKVKLTRTFSVVSGQSFKLQIAHTTNISDLNIKLYRVDQQTGTSAEVVGEADGTPFYWNRRGGEAADNNENGNLYPNSGNYINPDPNNNALAVDSGDQIFEGTGTQQANAIPLYWELDVTADKVQSSKYKDQNGNPSLVTNFIIDISWTDSSKETDVLYLIAKS